MWAVLSYQACWNNSSMSLDIPSKRHVLTLVKGIFKMSKDNGNIRTQELETYLWGDFTELRNVPGKFRSDEFKIHCGFFRNWNPFWFPDSFAAEAFLSAISFACKEWKLLFWFYLEESKKTPSHFNRIHWLLGFFYSHSPSSSSSPSPSFPFSFLFPFPLSFPFPSSSPSLFSSFLQRPI